MNFPTTRYTLIHRIATCSAEEDWALFLADYWRPLCRFAARWGRLQLDDAEDIASATLEAIIRNDLLARWSGDRRAKLRTLLCGVVRKVLANETRKRQRQSKHMQQFVFEIASSLSFDELVRESIPGSEQDAFYEAWAEELLQSAVESLLDDYHSEGRGNYFRVLYGRICDGMSVRDVAAALDLKPTDVDNYYRHARSRLETRLRDLVRWHIVRYAGPDEAGDEFETEWGRLGEFLKSRGGLEESLKKSYADFNSDSLREREIESMTTIMKNVRSFLKERPAS